jgi:hypothetical protein
MTKRTRYFFTGAALILALGLGTGLVAYYKGDLSMFKARVGPSELAYVPADATGVAYANVRQVMDSEFRQRLRAARPTGQAKNEFFNQTGIDIEHDIDSVVAASAAPGDPADHSLLLVRGHFDEGRIELLVRQHNGTVEDYKGKRLMAMAAGQAGGASPPCLAFPETGLAIIGSAATVKRAIDTRAGGQNITSNTDLMKLVQQLDGSGNTAWAVGGIEAVTSNPSVPPQVRQQLPGVEWMAVGVHVSKSINGHVLAEAKDDKAATDLRAVVNGAIAAGHMVAGRNPMLDTFLNTLQLTGAGREVDLSFNVPVEMLDMIPGMPGATRPAGLPAQRQ